MALGNLATSGASGLKGMYWGVTRTVQVITQANYNADLRLLNNHMMIPDSFDTDPETVLNGNVIEWMAGAPRVADGMLYIPSRGTLKLFPGDYIAYCVSSGWPILLNAQTAAAGDWTVAAGT